MENKIMALTQYCHVILLLISSVTCDYDVEYYPSQSTFNNNEKQVIHKIQVYKTSINKDTRWRIFNPNLNRNETRPRIKRVVDPVFYGHPKTREEQWNEHFLNKSTAFDQTLSLIKLIHNITMLHLNDCIPVIMYDKEVKSQDRYLFQNLLKDFPISYVHGYIDDNGNLKEPKLLLGEKECLHFILFLSDIKVSAKVLGKQSKSKVVLIARSSQWAVQEFLTSSLSRMFINLLVVGQTLKDDDDGTLEAPYILYTHKLFTDGLGASQPVVLTSWSHGKYSRLVNLFPLKMTKGYAGHRFKIAAANQPPFVFRRIISDADGGNPRVLWDGIEIRLLRLLADRNNFSMEIVEPREPHLGAGDAVSKEVKMGRADIGIGGIYMTRERSLDMDMSFSHSQDCVVFITLMSTALPRYRAILGPFHWHVWVALTFTYLFGIFPLAFSDKHTLRHLLHNSGEVENMFWYVFGTFTNCFTFLGKNSWSKTKKITTRLLIGWYWVFTIIITSCYTGSIIAFVTLPIFPETVDTIDQLLSGFYRVGTLDRGGWERWFINSSDPKTNKLFRKLELVSSVEFGIRNTTKAFFWPYAFFGSQAQLEYIVQANFTHTNSKRGLLHVSDECFMPFGVSMGFPNNSLYSAKLSEDLRRIYQYGIIDKIRDDVRWDMQRSSSGRLLAVGATGSLKIGSAEEKGLTLEDTQGMFLLLAAGFLMGAFALISEWMGGITRRCRKQKKPQSATSQEKLLSPPNSEEKIKAISNATGSNINFESRSQSIGSKDTLDGQIINVIEENITIHENLETHKWDSRRSSTVDLDKEVQEIFERDMKRKNTITGNTTYDSSEDRKPTASKGNFGDDVKCQ